MSRRVQPVYWDVVNQKLYDSTSAAIRAERVPYIIFREKIIVELHLVTDSALTPYTEQSDSWTYTASLDSDYDHTTAVMCKTLDADINKAGDWSPDSSGQATASEGEFSIRLDADTSSFQSKVGTLPEVRGTLLELLGWDGTTLVSAIRFRFRALNIIDDNGTVPGPAAIGGSKEYVDPADGLTKIALCFSDGTVAQTWTKP